jgi:sialate O-acetylesterase
VARGTSAPRKTVPRFSATAYFFAAALHRELKVPTGIIKSAWGGKPVQTFTSREALASIPEGKADLEALDKATAGYDPKKAAEQHKKALAVWEKKQAEWKEKPKDKRGRAPRKPSLARNPAATEGKPASLYNGMIHPFVGYSMRGAIWYQGEANAKSPETAAAYGKLFPLMINDWRQRWNDDFSFLWVQLANFRKPAAEPGVVDNWAHLQDEQRKTLSLKNTGMAIANDIGAADDIHPKNKKEVGERLARWSLAEDYGMDVVRSGPLFKSHKIEGDKVRITFTDAAGLKSRDGGPLKRFEIAGADKNWHWAEAKIDGESVIVSCPEVPKPAAVRYAWCSNPEGANLVNGAGLPASNFRTDDW